ncbi:MAG: hypothetical protein K2K89_04495 [Ruminococcus sp.]|nr:hypothetical protein [Ruminococcus sp.]
MSKLGAGKRKVANFRKKQAQKTSKELKKFFKIFHISKKRKRKRKKK